MTTPPETEVSVTPGALDEIRRRGGVAAVDLIPPLG